MKGEKLEKEHEYEDQVPFVAPSELKLALKRAELDVAMLSVEVAKLKEEVKMLRAVQRNHNPAEIPDWKMVFDEASWIDTAMWYKGNVIVPDPKPKKVVNSHSFPPYDTRNSKNVKKNGK